MFRSAWRLDSGRMADEFRRDLEPRAGESIGIPLQGARSAHHATDAARQREAGPQCVAPGYAVAGIGLFPTELRAGISKEEVGRTPGVAVHEVKPTGATELSPIEHAADKEIRSRVAQRSAGPDRVTKDQLPVAGPRNESLRVLL